jgi:2-polyprenyl-3-methyl-5-hydroxy-6-metoxy-1,4-benzoquinol methylase
MDAVRLPSPATAAASAAKPRCKLCGEHDATLVFTKNGYDLVRCDGCALAYIANPPTTEELAKIYSFDTGYHDDLADDASWGSRRFTKLAARHAAMLAKHLAKGRVLDVGCSAGFFLAAAKARGLTPTGLELSADTARLAEKRSNCAVVRGTLEEAELAPASFEAVTLWDVLEHVLDPLATLRAAHRLLAEDGLVVVSTPNIDGLFPRASYSVAARLDYWPHPEPPHHLFQFSVATLTKTLDAAGFDVVAMHHHAIPLTYSFGMPGRLATSPKALAYALVFAPTAIVGPLVGAGDWIYAFARRRG